MEAKVFIWFGNNFQNGNCFHLIWKQFPKWKPFPFDLDTCFQNGNGFHFVWIQFPIDLEIFFGLVSKSYGNGFHFGNMFPNQLDTCFHYGYFLRVFWISDHLEYVVCHAIINPTTYQITAHVNRRRPI